MSESLETSINRLLGCLKDPKTYRGKIIQLKKNLVGSPQAIISLKHGNKYRRFVSFISCHPLQKTFKEGDFVYFKIEPDQFAEIIKLSKNEQKGV